MSGFRLSFFLLLSAFLLTPTPALATAFGLTPSVFEEQLSMDERRELTVYIVRANPDRDAFLLVHVRNDPAQAITLTSGERLVLPLGEDNVKYEFAIDAVRIGESGVLDAGIEFLSDDTQLGSDGVDVQLGGVVKVHVDIVPEGSAKPDGESTNTVSFDEERLVGRIVAFVKSPGTSFLALTAVAFLVCLGLWASGRRGRLEGTVFFLCAFAFVVALFGWALQSGRIGIHLWTTAPQMNVTFEDGQFFLRASDVQDDVFLNPMVGQVQAMEGDWRYIATTPERIFVVPSTLEQRDLFGNRIFRFLESTIQPYDAEDLPGLVTGVRENKQGIYAVLMGEREKDGTPFWCLSNVWDQQAISCTMLDSLVRGPVVSVSFSLTEKNITLIHTAQGAYEYDVWRERLKPLISSPADSWEPPTEFSQPLLEEGILTRWGFAQLDGTRLFAPGKRTYFPLTPSVWLERVETASGSRIFVVDTRSFVRTLLTDMTDNERLYWLQNGGFVTSP